MFTLVTSALENPVVAAVSLVIGILLFLVASGLFKKPEKVEWKVIAFILAAGLIVLTTFISRNVGQSNMRAEIRTMQKTCDENVAAMQKTCDKNVAAMRMDCLGTVADVKDVIREKTLYVLDPQVTKPQRQDGKVILRVDDGNTGQKFVYSDPVIVGARAGTIVVQREGDNMVLYQRRTDGTVSIAQR
jgi:hypothetical protein